MTPFTEQTNGNHVPLGWAISLRDGRRGRVATPLQETTALRSRAENYRKGATIFSTKVGLRGLLHEEWRSIPYAL